MSGILLDTRAKWILLGVVGAVAILGWPFVGRSLAPTLLSGMVILYLAYAWNIVGGILGEMALSTMVFWAIGAYGLVLSLNSGGGIVLPVIIAVVVCAGLSALIVRIAAALGLTGLYLAVFTLIVYEIARALVLGAELLGRNEGLIIRELTSSTSAAYAFIVIILLAVAVNLAILSSSMGRRWLATKDDPVAATAIGVMVGRERVIAYAISGGLTALGGAAQAYYVGYAQPETALSMDLLITVILAVYVGGAGTLLGPLVGTVIVFGLRAVATTFSRDINTSLYAQIVQYAVAFAIIWLLSVHKTSRGGLVAVVRAWVRRIRGRAEVRSEEQALSGDQRMVAESVPASARPDPSTKPILEVVGASKRFGGVQVLRNVTIRVRPGEIVGLMGPNGAGKTTVCNVITGVVSPDEGSVLLLGEDISKAPTAKRYRLGIARTFQAARLFTSLSALDNVLVGGAGTERSKQVLAEYGLTKVRNTASAPTFVRRLIEVSRVVAAGKPVLLLDEPLAGLTPGQQALVLESVQRLAAQGCAILLIEHLIQSIAPVCHRLVVMANGEVIAEGEPEDVLKDPLVVDAYLGAAHDEETTS